MQLGHSIPNLGAERIAGDGSRERDLPDGPGWALSTLALAMPTVVPTVGVSTMPVHPGIPGTNPGGAGGKAPAPDRDRPGPASSLVSSTQTSHNDPLGPPCGGWLRETCGHGQVFWIPLRRHSWACECCRPALLGRLGKELELAETESRSRGWTLKFVTLTWAEDVARERTWKDLAHLVQWFRRQYGYCEYVRAPEYTRQGRIHLHLAMIIPYVRQEVLSRVWERYSGACVVDIRAAKPGLLKELAKYLGKSFSAGHISRSRGWPVSPAVDQGGTGVRPVPRDPETGLCSGCGSEHRFRYTKTEAEISFYEQTQLYIVPVCGCWSTGEDGDPPAWGDWGDHVPSE